MYVGMVKLLIPCILFIYFLFVMVGRKKPAAMWHFSIYNFKYILCKFGKIPGSTSTELLTFVMAKLLTVLKRRIFAQ